MFMSRQLVKKVNPIPTVEGRFCPPFSSGTSNIFHLPASLIKQQTGLLLATLQQLNELQFLHHFILMPKKPSQEFSMQTFDSGTILVYTHNPLILKIFSKLSKYIFYRKSPPHYLHNDISQRSINFFVNFYFGNQIFLPYFVTLVKNIPSLLNIFGGAKKSACWSPPSLSLHHMSVYPLRSARTTRSDPKLIPRKF